MNERESPEFPSTPLTPTHRDSALNTPPRLKKKRGYDFDVEEIDSEDSDEAILELADTTTNKRSKSNDSPIEPEQNILNLLTGNRLPPPALNSLPKPNLDLDAEFIQEFIDLINLYTHQAKSVILTQQKFKLAYFCHKYLFNKIYNKENHPDTSTADEINFSFPQEFLHHRRSIHTKLLEIEKLEHSITSKKSCIDSSSQQLPKKEWNQFSTVRNLVFKALIEIRSLSVDQCHNNSVLPQDARIYIDVFRQLHLNVFNRALQIKMIAQQCEALMMQYDDITNDNNNLKATVIIANFATTRDNLKQQLTHLQRLKSNATLAQKYSNLLTRLSNYPNQSNADMKIILSDLKLLQRIDTQAATLSKSAIEAINVFNNSFREIEPEKSFDFIR